MNIHLQVPIPQEKVKETREMLLLELKRIEAERMSIRHLFEILQMYCKHPNERSGYNDRDGGWSECPDCGRNT